LSPDQGWLVAASLSVQGKRQSHYRTALDGLPALKSNQAAAGRLLEMPRVSLISIYTVRNLGSQPAAAGDRIKPCHYPHLFTCGGLLWSRSDLWV